MSCCDGRLGVGVWQGVGVRRCVECGMGAVICEGAVGLTKIEVQLGRFLYSCLMTEQFKGASEVRDMIEQSNTPLVLMLKGSVTYFITNKAR